MGLGLPRAYPDPRELSAQPAAREGSGAAMCHADAGAGTSLPLEAPSPTRIKCEWLRHALLTPGKATPRQKGQTALPFTRPPYKGIKCQPLLHSARARRRQAAIPHSGCDQSPVRQLRSLLRHSGRCGDTVGTCDAVRDVLGTAPATVLPTPHTSFKNFPSAEPSNGMGTILGSGTGLDLDKTLACRSFRTPPRHAWRRYLPQ